jgi:thiol:disulfide interchange protein DsbD
MRNKEKPNRKIGIYSLIFLLLILLILPSQATSSSAETDSFRPISWEEGENQGSYSNPENSYDMDFDDRSTYAFLEIQPKGGFEALVYTFNIGKNVTIASLHYSWETEIGRGDCYDGAVEIRYWKWGDSTWDIQGRWKDQELSTRSLEISQEYINQSHKLKVKVLAKSACFMAQRSTTIKLYDIYVGMSHEGESSVESEILWYDYEHGINTAQVENKPVMLYFHTSWCSWCEEMDDNTLSDVEVIQKSFDFVTINIDADDRGDLKSRYDVYKYPTVVFLDATGNETNRVTGYVPSHVFLQAMSPSEVRDIEGSSCPDPQNNALYWLLIVIIVIVVFYSFFQARKGSKRS